MPYRIFSAVPVFLQVAEGTTQAAKESTGSILAFDLALIFRIGIQWINIGILAFVLVKFLYNPVKNFMAARADRIRDEIDSANQSAEDARILKARYEELIANIHIKEDEIAKERKRASDKDHEILITEAQKEANEYRRKAYEEIEIERKNAAEDIRKQIIEISTLMAARFVAMSMDKETQDKYIAEALADWSERTWQA